VSDKTYKVVGEAIVHGFKKGETFVADLVEHEEDLLIRGGHVEVVGGTATTPAPVVSSTTISTAPAGGSVTATS
jgi:hypothetical protein